MTSTFPASPSPSPLPAPGDRVEVAVFLPIYETFTYAKAHPEQALVPGTQVMVPFGTRRVPGLVVGPGKWDGGRVRSIHSVVPGAPTMGDDVLKLCRWAAEYYIYPLGMVFATALPVETRATMDKQLRITEKGLREHGKRSSSLVYTMLNPKEQALLDRFAVRAEKGLSRSNPDLSKQKDEIAKLIQEGFLESLDGVVKSPRDFLPWDSAEADLVSAAPVTLNDEQQAAIHTLCAAQSEGYRTFLLHGITASGKTEVYLNLIESLRKAGKSTLVLVPEIALTYLLAKKFVDRFEHDVFVWHSGLSPRQRLDIWQRLCEAPTSIVLGVRSAIFLPVRSLGSIIVDEEHDGTFKQESGLRYSAKDLAVMRARIVGGLAVLGSATPSLETYWNAEKKKYGKIVLSKKAPLLAKDRPLPQVEILDMRQHPPGKDGIFTPPLLQALSQNLENQQQTVLFLNRRGFSPVYLCPACGQVLHCAQCSVAMTWHRKLGRMLCHYCGETKEVPSRCSHCGQPGMMGKGYGTEQVEAAVRTYFPSARVARMDRDSVSKKNIPRVLEGMKKHAIDVLIGTQMVTKGHDFPGVTLVGILHPEHMLHMPDFRSSERTFQMLEQVAGRAGRGQLPGRVMVQTYCPQNEALQAVRRHDYAGYVSWEMQHRLQACYPPYSHMILIRIEGKEEDAVKATATRVAKAAKHASQGLFRVLGPSEAPIEIIRGKRRMQVWLSGKDRAALRHAAVAALNLGEKGVTLEIDVDPQSVL